MSGGSGSGHGAEPGARPVRVIALWVIALAGVGAGTLAVVLTGERTGPSPGAGLEALVRSARVRAKAAPGAVPGGGAVTRLAPPDRETYLREARQDPHHAPASVRRFAAGLAPRMEAALASEEGARAFFEELRACGTDAEGVESVRAICAVNAARLAERFPRELDAEWTAMRERLPDEVRASVEASGY